VQYVISETGQDWKIAALMIFIYVHFLFYKKGDKMVKNSEYYMKKALIEAYKAFNSNEVPVGAVIVKDGKIIAKSFNLKDSKNSVTKHAELIAIEKVSKKINNWRLSDCTMYVTLQPCPMCASAINQARLFKIVYGASANSVESSEIFNKIFSDSNTIIEKDVLSEDCSLILKKFFSNIR